MQAFLSQKKKLETEEPKHTGHFVPRDARKEVAQELKRSHFILGSDQSDFRSKNQVAQQDQNWNIDQEERKNYDKFSKQIRQSNIQIGMNNKTSFQTTHVQDYDRKSVDQGRVQAAIETKQDLRKAHFSFGSVSQGADNFLTTNMERFKKNTITNPSELRPQINNNNVNNSNNNNNGPDKFKSAGNKILNGNEKPNYQSSMKDSMVQHDLAQSYKNLAQQQEQGKNVRKHNFQFGYGGNENLQSEYQNFQQDRAKSVPYQGPSFRNVNDVKRSNIEIGNRWQGTDYISMQKQTQQLTNRDSETGTLSQNTLNPTEAANNTKLDLRKSHFNVGNAAIVNESSAKSAFQSHAINNDIANEKSAIQNKMQRGNFRIGDEKTKSSQYETTYKQNLIPQDKLQDYMNKPDERVHLSGSINLGSHQGQFVSEAKSKYIGTAGEKDTQAKSMIEKNRAPNFKFGDGHTHEMTTVTKSQYDYKGNPVEIRSYLDEQKKADLKQHHFNMGSHTTEYQTSSLKINSDQNGNPNSSNGFKFESKSLLKNSGQRIFGGNSPQQANANGDYKTTNQSYIKWIQPAPTQINMSMGGPASTQVKI